MEELAVQDTEADRDTAVEQDIQVVAVQGTVDQDTASEVVHTLADLGTVQVVARDMEPVDLDTALAVVDHRLVVVVAVLETALVVQGREHKRHREALLVEDMQPVVEERMSELAEVLVACTAAVVASLAPVVAAAIQRH